jgi:hypothetical protein
MLVAHRTSIRSATPAAPYTSAELGPERIVAAGLTGGRRLLLAQAV